MTNQRSAADYGGDPTRVMAVGESSGALNLIDLLAASLAGRVAEPPLFRRLVLQTELAGGAGLNHGEAGALGGKRPMVGMSGVALTDLRPAGKAEIDGRRLDVTCGGFIEAGSRVRVVDESDFRILVEKLDKGPILDR